MDTMGLLLAGVGLILWLSQLINVAFTDGRYLRSPLRKLIWFAVVLFLPVVGALCFFFWKRQAVADVREATRAKASQLLGGAYRKTLDKTAEHPAAGKLAQLAPRAGTTKG